MSSIELSTNVTPPSLPPFSELEIPRYIYPTQVFDLTKSSTIQLLNEWDDGVDSSRVDQPPPEFPIHSVSSSLHETYIVPLHHRLTPITSQDIPACKRPPSRIPAHDYPLQRQYLPGRAASVSDLLPSLPTLSRTPSSKNRGDSMSQFVFT